jgi:hypothetical protein
VAKQRCFCCGQKKFGCQNLPPELAGDKKTLYCQDCIELIRQQQENKK